MKIKLNEIISFLILIILFSLSIYVNIQKDYSNYCELDNSCILNLIDETKNFNLCEKSSKISFCYESISIKYNQSDFCLKTENLSSCYTKNAVLKNNILLCDTLDIKEKDQCIFEVVIYNDKIEYCDLSSQITKCIYSYAIFKNDSQFCSKSGEFESSCFEKLK